MYIWLQKYILILVHYCTGGKRIKSSTILSIALGGVSSALIASIVFIFCIWSRRKPQVSLSCKCSWFFMLGRIDMVGVPERFWLLCVSLSIYVLHIYKRRVKSVLPPWAWAWINCLILRDFGCMMFGTRVHVFLTNWQIHGGKIELLILYET